VQIDLSRLELIDFDIIGQYLFHTSSLKLDDISKFVITVLKHVIYKDKHYVYIGGGPWCIVQSIGSLCFKRDQFDKGELLRG
jgi:hypothetical protein